MTIIKNFLKKYWPAIAWVSIVSLALFYFIPDQEKHYLEPEIDTIERKSTFALLLTELVLFVTLFILAAKNLKRLTDLVTGLFYSAVFFWSLYLFLHPFFLSGTYLLNRLMTKGIAHKKYLVTSSLATDRLILYDYHSKETFFIDQLPANKDSLKPGRNDSITVAFKRGLLGFNYDPVILSR